jgi:type IV pilus assembly protein PilW
MSLSTTSRASGFTLVELMTGLAVSSVVLLAVAGAVIGQARAYEINLRTREAVGSTRRGLAFIESKIKLAGFGIHPQFGFELDLPTPSDSATGPDQLFVRYRDPLYRRRGELNAAKTTLTVDRPTSRLEVDQILLLICLDGSATAYVSVSERTETSVIKLFDAYPDGRFPRQVVPPGCLLNTGDTKPWVVKVDEYRFFVNAPPDNTVLRMARSAGGAGVPVIADVEDFQVAYVMNRWQGEWPVPAQLPVAPDSNNGNWVYGDVQGVVERPNEAAPICAAGTCKRTEVCEGGVVCVPALNLGYRHVSRFTSSSANIRSVRLSLVTSSNRQFESMVGQRRRPALENRPQAPATDGVFRSVVTTQVAVPNMASRSMFAPVSRNVEGG